MNALSRREEDALLKSAKARALKECDPIVKGIVNIFFSFTSVTELKQESSRIRGMHARPISLTAMGM